MKLYELFLASFYRIFKRDKRFKYYNKLRLNLKRDRSYIIKEQNKNIRKLIDHAYHQTAYYKELMDSLKIHPNDIRTKDDLNKLPELTKQLIKDNIDKLTSNDHYSQNIFKDISGGSTGEQAILYKSTFFDQMSRGSWLRNNSIIGWMPSDKSAWIWGSSIKIKNKFKNKISIFINRRIVLNAFDYTSDDFPIWYQRILKFKPKVLFGYSSIILEFSKFIIDNNLKLPSVKIVVSTSEKLRDHELIENAFNCKVYDQYGCREVIAIGIELDMGKMILTDDVVVLNTNKKNEFLLTPLFSYGFPLINYKVGDIGKIKENTSIDKKYPFTNMDLQIGRVSDYFLRENNLRISSVAFSSAMDPTNFGIEVHQIIQVNYMKFEINYIPLENSDLKKYYKSVTEQLEHFFGKNLTIKFKGVLKIPVEKSGKLLLFKRIFKLSV